MNVSKKTYIEFLNENFDIDKDGRYYRKPECPEKIKIDSLRGGFPRVLVENQDQYEPITGLTAMQMFKNWYKQAKAKNN